MLKMDVTPVCVSMVNGSAQTFLVQRSMPVRRPVEHAEETSSKSVCVLTEKHVSDQPVVDPIKHVVSQEITGFSLVVGSSVPPAPKGSSVSITRMINVILSGVEQIVPAHVKILIKVHAARH